jgi:hypothetical protein
MTYKTSKNGLNKHNSVEVTRGRQSLELLIGTLSFFFFLSQILINISMKVFVELGKIKKLDTNLFIESQLF